MPRYVNGDIFPARMAAPNGRVRCVGAQPTKQLRRPKHSANNRNGLGTVQAGSASRDAKGRCLGRSQQGSEAGGAEALASDGRSGALDREYGNALQRPSTWALGDSRHRCPPGTLEDCPIRRRGPSELEVGITAGVLPRGPERSEGLVGSNDRVLRPSWPGAPMSSD